jgi:uncharacterized protein YjeT (DUF2065 family)
MKGPISKDIKVGFGLDGLEVALTFAGQLVVIGLLMESGPEAWKAIITRIWPHREVTGNALVTIGVFAEVAIGLFIARHAKRAQMQAETQIAEVTERASRAEERAALAEQAAAEANLARVQIEQRMSPRKIGDSERRELIQLLSASAGQTVDIVVFDHHIQETKMFASRGILSLFLAAKWKCRLWESRAATYRIPGASLLIVTGEGHVDKFKDLAAKMSGLLNKSGIDCDVSHGKFGCTGEFKPGEFHLECEEPRQFMGHRIVSPFRIQIGAKQVVPPVSIRTFTVRPAPTKEAD